MALTAMAAGPPASRSDTAVAMRVGAPAQLAISPSTRKLVVASGETARVAVSAHDAFGNPTERARASRSPSTDSPAPSRSAPAVWAR